MSEEEKLTPVSVPLIGGPRDGNHIHLTKEKTRVGDTWYFPHGARGLACYRVFRTDEGNLQLHFQHP